MSSFRLTARTSPNIPVDATSSTAASHDSATRQTETMSVAQAPLVRPPERAAPTAPLTAELPPAGPRTLNPERLAAIPGADGQMGALAAGLNAPMSMPPAPDSWPPDPFAGPSTPANDHIWQAIARTTDEPAPAPRPTMAFGFAESMSDAEWLASAKANQQSAAPAMPFDASAKLAAEPGAPLPIVMRPKQEQSDAAQNVEEGAFWFRPRNRAKADPANTAADNKAVDGALPAVIQDVQSQTDNDVAQQQVFEQTALSASFAPMSAQIVQQRDAEHRRRKDFLQRARHAFKTLKLFGRGQRDTVRIFRDDDAGPDTNR